MVQSKQIFFLILAHLNWKLENESQLRIAVGNEELLNQKIWTIFYETFHKYLSAALLE